MRHHITCIRIAATSMALACFPFFASAGSVSKIVPQAAATQPPLALVQTTCLPTPTDMVLDVWNFYSGYLYCRVYDANTGGDHVYRQNPDGSFTIIIKGGGHVDVNLMIQKGIPSKVASTLYAGLHK